MTSGPGEGFGRGTAKTPTAPAPNDGVCACGVRYSFGTLWAAQQCVVCDGLRSMKYKTTDFYGGPVWHEAAA